MVYKDGHDGKHPLKYVCGVLELSETFRSDIESKIMVIKTITKIKL